MITYVNTVFVSNRSGANNFEGTLGSLEKGLFIFWDVDNNTNVSQNSNTTRFKIGMGTGKTAKQLNPTTKAMDDVPVIKWSNIINVADIKSITPHINGGDTEDKVYIDFSGIDDALVNTFAQGGKRIIVRLTFKDLPTRFRKWTESYEYVTKEFKFSSDAKAYPEQQVAYINGMATDIANMINKEWKRARVIAKVGTYAVPLNAQEGASKVFKEAANGTTIQLEAMKYDDDNSVDSINWYNKVRFNANVYYTDPAAEGWESLNKHFPNGLTIDKIPGKTDPCSAKLVRDREAQAMGYEGILNRGEGTWPIIKPAMETNLSNTYNGLTIEFENMYRTADDLFRKTKQTVEIYATTLPITVYQGLCDNLGL